MKIAIDISPLSSGHKVRGVGFYLKYLKKSLTTYFPEHDYIFFNKRSELTGAIDVVHYPYFDPFFLTLPFNKKYKTVVTVHDLTPLVFPEHFPAGIKGNLKWHVQKYNLKKVDAIIADSFASKKDIITIAGIAEKNVHVAHLAAGEEFQHMNSSSNLSVKYTVPEKFVLYVGDVTWNKNVPRLIKAAEKADVHLVMVGKTLASKEFDASNPWNKDLVEVQKLVKKNSNISILGFVPNEDLVSLYNSATLFAFPSIYEGFGLPVIEAMQSSCPVVTSKGGSLAEVAGEAACFVDPYDVDDIARGISEVFNNKTLQKELAVKGLKQAKTFSWKRTAEETIKVYNKVLLK
jgi:glycosyltransferase involved in cell wall biosynthesis